MQRAVLGVQMPVDRLPRQLIVVEHGSEAIERGRAKRARNAAKERGGAQNSLKTQLDRTGANCGAKRDVWVRYAMFWVLGDDDGVLERPGSAQMVQRGCRSVQRVFGCCC